MKKIVSILLSMMMLLSLFSCLLFPAAAVETVSAVKLTYDSSAVAFNTFCTEGDVQKMIRSSVGITSEGCSVDKNNTFLMYKYGSDYRGIGDGTGMMSTEKEYAIEYCLNLKSGYDWAASIKALPLNPLTPVTDVSGFSVFFNGAERNDAGIKYNDSWDNVRVIIPLGKPSSAPIILGISINENNISLGAGESASFSVNVIGSADKSCVWSVEGANSPTTTISSTGLLSVGADETAETLVVRVTSVFDSTKTDQRTVTVLTVPATIESVSVSPDNVSMAQGESRSFSAIVTGEQTDKSVTWSVSGANEAGTVISSSGNLKIDVEETAKKITVRATSNFDPLKYGTATVTVTPSTRVESVELSFNEGAFEATYGITEGEANSMLRSNLGTTSAIVTIDKSNSGLAIRNGSSWRGIYDGTGIVSPEKEYGIRCNVYLKTGYDWPTAVKSCSSYTPVEDIPGFSIIYNGVERKDAQITYNDAWNMIMVCISDLHIHDFATAVVTAPKCLEKGYTTHSCVCGKSYKDSFVEALDHDFGAWTVVTPATCKVEGTERRDCSRCEVFETRATEKGAHTPSAAVRENEVPATCLALGSYDEVVYCSLCGAEISREAKSIETVAHIPGEPAVMNAVPATCTSEGSYDEVICCSVCWIRLSSEKRTIEKKPHDFRDAVTPATLSEDGKVEKTCSACGAKDDGSVVTIPKASKVGFAKTKFVYDGTVIRPTLLAFDSEGNLIRSAYYKAEWSNKSSKAPGTYTLTVTFRNYYSGQKTLTYKIIPRQVTGLKTEKVTKTAIKLSWKKLSEAKYYKVEQSTDGKTWTKAAVVTANAATVKNLKTGAKYQFRVKALDSTKKIAGKVSAVLKTGTLTAAPTISKLTSTKSKTATVSWKKVTGAKSYIVYKSTDGKTFKAAKTGLSGTSYTLTKLTGGKKIYVKVIAVNAYGAKSAASAVKSVKVKK